MKSIILSLALIYGVRGSEFETLRADASADLQKALTELSTLREQIQGERLPLAQQITMLEQKLIDEKAALAKAQRFQENQLVELNALKTEARRAGDEVKYIDSLLSEYAKAFRGRLNFVEEPRYRAVFENLEKASGAVDISSVSRFAEKSAILTNSLARARAALGGEILAGRALDNLGRVQEGKVALIGPVAVFASENGDLAGVLQQELNKAEPTVLRAEKSQSEACRALATTGKGSLMLDATLGNAFKLAALHETLYEKLAKGGLIMIPLLGLGLAAVLTGFFKWIQLSRVRLVKESELQGVLQSLEAREQDAALEKAQQIPGIAGDLLVTAVRHSDEKKEYVEEILYEKMLGARAKLERGIAFLALSATTGPLMGLLGTVMGMIATFKVISSFGSGDPKTLAAGISEALICTATGMAVAIPSLLLHAFLSRKAKGILGRMEQTSVGFINGLPAEEKTFAF